MCLFRLPRFRTGSRQGGKRAEQHIAMDYLDTVLSNFSGYIAADELYDGPFCVLSIVDNHNFQRLVYEVLDHDPTHNDIIRFFQRFKKELDARELTLKGITTDGSSLYPVPIAGVFGDDMQHQVCEFHVIKELTKAVLRAVAKVRKQLKTTMPKLGRGRPSKSTKKASKRKKRIEKKITDLFENRYLFVKHHLTASEKRTLKRVTKGLPHLRTLRDIMDEGLSPVRPPLPNRYRAGEAGQAVPSRTPLQTCWQGTQQTVLLEPGEGADVSRRLAVAVDIQCSRAWLSPPSQDAKNRVPRANPSPDQPADRHGHAARRTSTRADTNKAIAT